MLSSSGASFVASSGLPGPMQRSSSHSGREVGGTSAGSSTPPARFRLADALTGCVAPGLEIGLADALLACLGGSTLQLRRLDPAWLTHLPAIGPAAWCVLDTQAPGGISAVDLPAVAEDGHLSRLALGLAELPALRSIDLSVPRAGRAIDLSCLHALRGPLSLHLDCHRADGWQVTVPTGCRIDVRGAAMRQLHAAKPVVRYVDGQGRPTGEHHALEGIAYWGKPPASIVAACGGDLDLAHARAKAVNLNGKARFDGEAPLTSGDQPQRKIVCRHITLQVLTDWQLCSGWRRIGREAKASYEPYTRVESLQQHVPARTEGAGQRLMRRPATAVFRDRAFGQVLQAQLAQIEPDGERRFMLHTQCHAMALALRRTHGRCVVTLHDPNVSALPLKLVATPAQLEGILLRDLLARSYPAYLPPGAGDTAVLRAFGPPQGGGVQVHGFDDAFLASGAGLHWLLSAGATDPIERSVRRMVQDCAGDPRVLTERLSAQVLGYSGLNNAVALGYAATAEALVAAVLTHAAPHLDVESLAAVLSRQSRSATGTGLVERASRWLPAFVVAYARRVVAASSLDIAARSRLLRLPDGRAVLGACVPQAAADGGADAQAYRNSCESLEGVLRAILGAAGLSREDRLRLLGGTDGKPGEGGWARPLEACWRRDDAVPAAIALCAGLDFDAGDLLAAGGLRVDTDDVLRVLAAAGDQPLARHWAQRLGERRNLADFAGVMAARHVDADGREHRALSRERVLANPHAAAAQARAILALTPAQAGPRHLERFLVARPLNGGPLLHALVDAPRNGLAAQQALYLLVREIAQAASWPSQRFELLGACDLGPAGNLTAAAHALRPGAAGGQPTHPEAAAAMACAIVESPLSAPDQLALLNALRVDLPAVLSLPPPGWPAGSTHWSLRLLRALEGSTLPRAVLAPVFLRAGELGVGGKVPAKGGWGDA